MFNLSWIVERDNYENNVALLLPAKNNGARQVTEKVTGMF
jgi:hypothetical protein